MNFYLSIYIKSRLASERKHVLSLSDQMLDQRPSDRLNKLQSVGKKINWNLQVGLKVEDMFAYEVYKSRSCWNKDV